MKKFLFFVVLLAAGSGYLWWWDHKRQQSAAEPRKPILERLERGDVTAKVSATGKVAPRERILISTDVPLGIVVAVNNEAEPGRFVKAGTWLVKLDDRSAQARLKQAEAALDTAKAARDAAKATKEEAEAGVEYAKEAAAAAKKEHDARLKLAGDAGAPGLVEAARLAEIAANKQIRLVEAKIAAADAAIKTAESNILTAQAGIDLARHGVEMMTIAAKNDGIILDRRVIEGQPVSPQTSPLFVMMPTVNDWEIYALVSETDIGQVQKGQTVEFTLDAYSGKNVKFKATVLKKDHVPAQLQTQPPIGLGLGGGPTNFGVTLSVSPDARMERDYPLLAGMTANVDILINSVKDKLRVPKPALQYQPATLPSQELERIETLGKEGWQPIWVWTKAQRAEMVFIKTGVDDGSFVEIKDALAGSGEGPVQLEPGMEVVIEEPPPEEKPPGFFGSGKAIPLPR